MFGYVIPDKMNMFVKDYYNYKAYYCGLCKRIGKDCSQLMRISTNYDMVFFDMFCHAVLDIKPNYKNEPCILSPKKKSIVKGDELTDKIVDINTLLIYYKLLDDKLDSNKPSIAKSMARGLVVSSQYKKAKKNFPELDKLFDPPGLLHLVLNLIRHGRGGSPLLLGIGEHAKPVELHLIDEAVELLEVLLALSGKAAD